MARSQEPADDVDEGPEYEVDLHRLRGEQALRRLKQELHAWRVRGLASARIITGRGLTSASGPVLAPLIESWLDSSEARGLGIAKWKSTHRGGAFEVHLEWGKQ